MKKYKNIVKLSGMILEALGKLRLQRLKLLQSGFEDFSYRCAEAGKESHLFYAALEKGWLRSTARIIARTRRNLEDFSYRLHRFKELVDADEARMPKLSGILAELSEIDQELGEYQFNLKEKTISVVTEPVTLEDVYLGPFEIRLSIDTLQKVGTDRPYKVIALEPNPSGTDSYVTHPHVNSDMLCEGDGDAAIQKALEEGRLCDFFLLVTGILQTYNPHSPYVSMEDWEGSSCYDCGCSMSSEDRYYCEFCGNEYCTDCSSYCQKCDTTICLGCAYSCPSCNEPVCKNCTAKCKDCEQVFCEDCLNEEGLCQDCQEQRKEDNDEEQEPEEQEAHASVQPDGVEQAGVLPRHD
jgi:hypothetical protein